MRMDTDSCILSDMPSNVMREHSLDYMYHSSFAEPGDAIEELRDSVSQHPGNPQNVDHNHSADLLWGEQNHTPHMQVFSTNLEWFYMPAFRHPEVLEWVDAIMQDGGIYDHRWGDAPLRAIMATRFFNETAVGRFCNFTYGHSIWDPFLPCDQRNDIHAWPGRSSFGWNEV
jgi:Glycolipid 2-alpha-mannosyltransferase